MDEVLNELQTTAERVERFREIHDDAVKDLRAKVADARAVTCQSPVMPWGTRKRSVWCGANASTS